MWETGVQFRYTFIETIQIYGFITIWAIWTIFAQILPISQPQMMIQNKAKIKGMEKY